MQNSQQDASRSFKRVLPDQTINQIKFDQNSFNQDPEFRPPNQPTRLRRPSRVNETLPASNADLNGTPNVVLWKRKIVSMAPEPFIQPQKPSVRPAERDRRPENTNQGNNRYASVKEPQASQYRQNNAENTGPRHSDLGRMNQFSDAAPDAMRGALTSYLSGFLHFGHYSHNWKAGCLSLMWCFGSVPLTSWYVYKYLLYWRCTNRFLSSCASYRSGLTTHNNFHWWSWQSFT